MVHGLDIFKGYFSNYSDCFVIIGGTACDIIMEEAGVEFRGTKDLDIVVLIELINEEFGKSIWEFIKKGEYEIKQKSSGKSIFYRFSKPKNKEFPAMLELFSKKTFELKFDGNITPIHISDEVSSLSAIILNNEYYELLKRGNRKINNVPVLSEECLIVFKIKAWLDLSERRKNGQNVDSKIIKKHKNDVFRLLMLLTPEQKIDVGINIKEDIKNFVDSVDEVNLKDIKINEFSFNELLEMIRNIYL